MGSIHKVDALFVGYENQENLGLRYIMAYIEAKGFRSALAPYKPGNPTDVLEVAKRSSPDLIGFSIIFQYNLHEFGELMEMLRQEGVRAHFTAGGHYPSLRPVRTLAELKYLDSIVIFEGELTTVELLSKLNQPQEWPGILGLAFRREGEIVINPPRPLLANLDELPWPRRGEIRQSSRGRGMAPILASRGCLYNCSFCSIRQFYGGAPGPLRRIRSPQDVAAEMKYLYKSRGICLFLFQDDDFAAKSDRQVRWIENFLHELEAAGLKGKIGWKVSCRVDDIQPDVMARCRDHGLLVVYLGVESGSRLGLKTLNKHVTVEQNLAAMQTLKDVGLEFDMGFMLFDPDSTMETVRENLHFLRQVARMGGPPISFVKMLPLAGTAIEDRLAQEGRLMGSDIRPDYDLLDPRLDYYALFVALNFSFRNSDPNGLVERLRQAYFDCLVVRTFEPGPWTERYQQVLRTLCDRANQSALDVLDQAMDLVESCPDSESVALAWPRLRALAAREQKIQSEILFELDQVLATYSQGLYQAFKNETAV
ncbi:MAG: B12-binding domain-containing radical SAM protein [Candidatus Aminicenantes bacterium]|nr:MAG: B12-binding domain-containing radical SAM protein [Candidatus Aminicenantes bacterium]